MVRGIGLLVMQTETEPLSFYINSELLRLIKLLHSYLVSQRGKSQVTAPFRFSAGGSLDFDSAPTTKTTKSLWKKYNMVVTYTLFSPSGTIVSVSITTVLCQFLQFHKLDVCISIHSFQLFHINNVISCMFTSMKLKCHIVSEPCITMSSMLKDITKQTAS